MLHIFINSSENKKDPNITYLTGYNPSFCILIYDSESSKKCMFIANFELGMYNGIKCFGYNKDSFKKNILKYFKIDSDYIKKIGINKKIMSIAELKFLKEMIPADYTDNSKLFIEKRLIKSKIEIKKISYSCQITDKILSLLFKVLKNGELKTESDIDKFLKKKAIDFEVELAFNPVIASGSNSSMPHHIPTKTILDGFILIDFGVKYKGYCSDITRMVYIGKPTLEEIEHYNKVLDLYNLAIKTLKNGCYLKDIDNIVRKQLGKYFLHSLGHGIGIEIHEQPSISLNSKDSLKENMVFSIEPGYYLKSKFGIRIEDTILFSKNKIISLTKTPKKLFIIRKKKEIKKV
jgi:Xaa-Pro aminopeptidase